MEIAQLFPGRVALLQAGYGVLSKKTRTLYGPPALKPKVVNLIGSALKLETLNVILYYWHLNVGGAAAKTKRMRKEVLLAGNINDYTTIGSEHITFTLIRNALIKPYTKEHAFTVIIT